MRLLLKHYSLAVLIALLFMAETASAQFWNPKKTDLLPADQAFAVSAFIDGDLLRIQWSIAEDYYMYRDQFGLQSTTPGVEFGDLVFPAGVIEQDPEFGEVTVYFYNVEVTAPVLSLPSSGGEIELTILGQGCNKPVGVCYPPQTRSILVDFTSANVSLNGQDTQPQVSASKPTPGFSAGKRLDESKSYVSYIFAAFLIGLALSLTPCVLPMIPIVLAIVAGQRNPSKLSSGFLACCYVAGHVLVYAIAGWFIAQGGGQLQAHFQSPYVIGFVCLLLVVLASALFGAFKIQLPSSLQTKLNSAKPNSKSLIVTAFIMGAISSLVVGACVSPLLIVAVGAVITIGDPALGSAVMSSLALGMGTLLIALGFGAGWLLPKTGAWMNQVQIILGFMVLGAAIFIASFIDLVPVLYFWSGLMIWFAIYLWKIAAEVDSDVLSTLLKALCVFHFLWGSAAFVGALTGGKDISDPLATVSFTSSVSAQRMKLPFNRITKLPQAQALLNSAKANGKPVLVDFYADWCLDCKRMQRTTFTEPQVHMALDDWVLLEADVTETNDDSEALKKFFDVFGPPATLFIRSDGSEHQDLRQYGYMNKSDFLNVLAKAKP